MTSAALRSHFLRDLISSCSRKRLRSRSSQSVGSPPPPPQGGLTSRSNFSTQRDYVVQSFSSRAAHGRRTGRRRGGSCHRIAGALCYLRLRSGGGGCGKKPPCPASGVLSALGRQAPRGEGGLRKWPLAVPPAGEPFGQGRPPLQLGSGDESGSRWGGRRGLCCLSESQSVWKCVCMCVCRCVCVCAQS